MDWWVWLLLGIEALVVIAGAVSLVRVLRERGREKGRAAELISERDREIAAWGEDDRATLSPRDRAIRGLAECWALWSHVPGQGVAAIRAAADALTLDVDSPALRELAGLSERSADAWDVRDLLIEALDQLQVDAVAPDSDEGRLLALRYYCLEWREGRLRDEQLAEWAHGTIGHDGPLVAQELVELVDIFVTPISSKHDEVEQAVDRFLGHVAGLKPTRG